MEYYVYVIKSRHRDWIYVGITNNVDRRIEEHNKKRNKSTKPYAPFNLLYTEKYPTRAEARKREKYLKSTVGKRWIRKQWLCGPV